MHHFSKIKDLAVTYFKIFLKCEPIYEIFSTSMKIFVSAKFNLVELRLFLGCNLKLSLK